MFRRSQLSREQQAKRRKEEEREKVKKLKNSDMAASFSGEEADSTEKMDGATATDVDVDEEEREDESVSKDTAKNSQPPGENDKHEKSEASSTKSKASSTIVEQRSKK